METFEQILETLQRQQQEAMAQATMQRNPLAQLFAAWAKDMCTPAIQKKDQIALNQAKVLLLDKFFEWRASIPKKYYNEFFVVFEAAYHQVKLAQLSLTPPALFLPPPQPQPIYITKNIHYAGFQLGETVVDDTEDE